MKLSEYMTLSERTMRPEGMTSKARVLCAALGLTGEAGEVADHIKKVCFHNHKLDKGKVKEELGDLLWYVAWMAKLHDMTLDEVAQGNIDKLTKRYPDGFSTERSINREGAA